MELKDMTFKQVWKDMPARLSRMLWKLLSVKVMVLVAAIWLILEDKVTGWHAVVLFCVTSLIVIFGKEAIKWLEVLKGLK